MIPGGATPLLRLEGLHVTYPGGERALRGFDLSIGRNEVLALVGESAAGKSTVADCVLGLLPEGAAVKGRVVLLDQPPSTREVDVLYLSRQERQRLRGRRIGYVAQSPFDTFDPIRSVGHHIRSAWTVHGLQPPAGQPGAGLTALGIEESERMARLRPHQWSGGMLQRASILAATALGPDLVIADEPTSALDTDLALATLRAMRLRTQALLLITHDLRLAGQVADRIAVIYAGVLIEQGDAAAILERPAHPYTRALLAALPQESGLPQPLSGGPPDARAAIVGCAFAPRCRIATTLCRQVAPTPVRRDGGTVICHEANAA